jgi:nicotinamide riboside kinase
MKYDDLVKRLRAMLEGNLRPSPLGKKAADAIEELEAKLAKAEIIIRIIASDKWDERLGEAVDLACEYLAELKEEKR